MNAATQESAHQAPRRRKQPPPTDAPLLDILNALLRAEAADGLENPDDAFISRLLHLSDIHGIEPLIFAALEHQPQRNPTIDTIRDRLKPKVQAQAVTELTKKVAIRTILERFAQAQIPVVILKGAALGYSLYPEPYLRPRGDLDLLVSETDREAADTLLIANGYQRLDAIREAGSFQITYQQTQTTHPTDPIDLHWKLNDHRLFADLLPPEQLLQASEPAPSLSPHARTLCRVHAMLHACMHRAANFTTHYHVAGEDIVNPDRLIWLYDIHLLAQAFTDTDWEQFCDFARANQLRAVCRDALLATQRALTIQIPDPALRRLAAPGPTEPSAAYLRTGLTRKLLTDIKAQPNWQARIRLAASYALPPEEFMRRKYDKQTWPLPALYLLHLGRGIRKLLLT